jgi:peptidoglycan/LPS O-acetylase OafA/YrhL
VLNAYRSFHVFHRPHPFPVQVLLAAGILAVVLAFSALTYYFIESPMQRVGHRFARLLQNRFGPDAITESVPVPDAPAVPAIPADDAGQAQAAERTTGPPLDRSRGEAGSIPQDARPIT